jgi:hypothetical protein
VLCGSDAQFASPGPPVISADDLVDSSDAVEVLRAWQERLGVKD